MIQFIKNNRPYAQTSREDFAQKYLLEGCVEVPVLYAYGTFIDAVWNGSEFIEGATPEEIAEANKIIIEQNIESLKQQQYQELLPTDWYYTRFIEAGQEVPLEIKQQRQEIRDKYNNLIQEINNE